VLEGTNSDGYIRRGLLRGLTIASRSPTLSSTTPSGAGRMSRDLVLQLMTATDYRSRWWRNGRLWIAIWDDIAAPRSAQPDSDQGPRRQWAPGCVPTREPPPAHAARAGKPMLEHIMAGETARASATSCWTSHYLGHIMKLPRQWPPRLGVGSIPEGRDCFGTGARSPAQTLAELPFVVTNGDVSPFIRTHQRMLHSYMCTH